MHILFHLLLIPDDTAAKVNANMDALISVNQDCVWFLSAFSLLLTKSNSNQLWLQVNESGADKWGHTLVEIIEIVSLVEIISYTLLFC